MSSQNLNVFGRQIEEENYNEYENNVTKAFLLVIKNNLSFRKKFLKLLKVRFKLQNKCDFIFQVSQKEKYRTRNVCTPIICKITSKYKLREKDFENNIKDNRPDGLIIDDTHAIMIEAKVNADSDKDQIGRYNKDFFNNKADIISLYWEDISSICRKIKVRKPKTIGEYLANHFSNYLEEIKLSGFDGIPFFNENYDYDERAAKEILKQLIIDLKEKRWFKDNALKFQDRPKTSVWDAFFDGTVSNTTLIHFPHYSVYIFPGFFGIDLIFHKNDMKKILKDNKLKEEFLECFKKIADISPDYFFRIVAYRKIANKRAGTGVRTGASYDSFIFEYQMSRFIKNHRKEWKKKLELYLNMLISEEYKQISILHNSHYEDKTYMDKGKFDLTKPENVLEMVKKVYDETQQVHSLLLKVHSKTKLEI